MAGGVVMVHYGAMQLPGMGCVEACAARPGEPGVPGSHGGGSTYNSMQLAGVGSRVQH